MHPALGSISILYGLPALFQDIQQYMKSKYEQARQSGSDFSPLHIKVAYGTNVFKSNFGESCLPLQSLHFLKGFLGGNKLGIETCYYSWCKYN